MSDEALKKALRERGMFTLIEKYTDATMDESPLPDNIAQALIDRGLAYYRKLEPDEVEEFEDMFGIAHRRILELNQ